MSLRLPRLPPSAESVARRAAWHRGRERSPETREKMRLAHLGKRPTAETRAKLSAARKARRPETLEECRARNLAKRRRITLERFRNWRKDQLIAAREGKLDLLRDIKQSWGWRTKRKMHDPIVSDGFFKGRVVYVPWLLALRGSNDS